MSSIYLGLIVLNFNCIGGCENIVFGVALSCVDVEERDDCGRGD